MGFHSAAEILEEMKRTPKQTQWGCWRLEDGCLVPEQSPDYYVDLRRITDSAKALDWIVQLSTKSWVTEQDLGFLVKALDYILGFQQRYCGGGFDKTVDPVPLILRYEKAVSEADRLMTRIG
jgi:hypothetical protein